MCKMRGGVSNSSARRISVIDHGLRPARDVHAQRTTLATSRGTD